MRHRGRRLAISIGVVPTPWRPGAPVIAIDPAGRPAIAWVAPASPGYRLTLGTFDGSSWIQQTVTTSSAWPKLTGLAWDGAGNPVVANAGPYCKTTRISRETLKAKHRRARASSLDPGWKQLYLPVGEATDEDSAGFPAERTTPGELHDDSADPAPLLLYRFVGTGDSDSGNRLRLVKDATATRIVYWGEEAQSMRSSSARGRPRCRARHTDRATSCSGLEGL